MTTPIALASLHNTACLLASATALLPPTEWSLDSPTGFDRETALHHALWLALDLLPPAPPVTAAALDDPSVGSALTAALTELQSRPISDYPTGTSALVVAVGDLAHQHGVRA